MSKNLRQSFVEPTILKHFYAYVSEHSMSVIFIFWKKFCGEKILIFPELKMLIFFHLMSVHFSFVFCSLILVNIYQRLIKDQYILEPNYNMLTIFVWFVINFFVIN